MTAKPGPARLRRERRRQTGQNKLLKVVKWIVPVLILLGTLILIPNPGSFVGLDDLAATILATFAYWRLRSGKIQSTEGEQIEASTPTTQKGDSWFVNLITLVWGSHKIYLAMTPGWRKLIKGFIAGTTIALLIAFFLTGVWLYGLVKPSPIRAENPTAIPSPFWPSGQTLQGSNDIPIEGFGVTPTEQGSIPLEGFESMLAPQAVSGEVFTLEYPGGVGLYDWIWQQLGYSLTDASDPKGSFVCVYKADVRATGIEAAWKKNTATPQTIPISQQTIDVCGGVK